MGVVLVLWANGGSILSKLVGARQHMRDRGNCNRSYAHDDLLRAARIRAMMLKASTASVMMRAPVQASFCQS